MRSNWSSGRTRSDGCPTPLAPLQPGDPEFVANEYGAGVIVDSRGLIVTAYSLLGDESEYYVTTADRKTYKATVKGADPRSDLAVLSIDAADLPAIVLGNATTVKKGQIVISLGNPYGIARDGQASAAWGIVSNLGRKAPAEPSESDPSGRPTLHHFGTLIQTDARLHRGLSGGPLLNLRGEMIGLGVMFAGTADTEAAGAYAIPVDATFRRALKTLSEGREVEYGFLGIQPENLRPQEIRAGLQGTRVSQVVPGTPAARYGLRVGDIITAVDGTPIYDADGLVLDVGRLPVEAVARLSVMRSGNRRTVPVTLTKYAVRGKKIVTVASPAWRGLRVDYPTAIADAASYARGDASPVDDAVVAIKVAEGSPAWDAGLRRGTMIAQVAGTTVRNPSEFAAAVAGHPGPVQLRLAGEEKNVVRVVAPDRQR